MDPISEQIQESDTKTIDIYQHLKLNLKNTLPICDCETLPTLYCIPCKVSVCQKCTYENHRNHLLISKENSEINETEVDSMFQKTEDNFTTSEIFSDYERQKQNLIDEVERTCENLIQKILQMKKSKLDEIEHMFDNLHKNVDGLRQQINYTKKQLKDYYIQNKKFFNLEDGNTDETNTLFLLNYDILNICQIKEKEIKTIVENLSEDFKNYQISNEMLGKAMAEEFDKILFGNAYSESLENEINSKLNITSSIKKDIMINDEKYHPLLHFKYSVDKINQDHYKEINDRIAKYAKEIDRIKTKIFNSFISNKGLKEIEAEINTFENSKSKGAESLFCQRLGNNSISTSTIRTRAERQAEKLQFKSKDDVCLKDPLIKKYFAYLTIDLYGQYFKMETKELQSSHADLMIKVDSDLEDSDYAKIIEGTNTIVIYEKKNNKMTKKALKLTRNPFGYTVFPTGCRCILIGSKVYITGGVDEKGEYPNVLIYDKEQDKLKRIMDLCEPRSFHTMIYNDAFETIMVIGGEYSNTVEIFDPLTNRWQLLPPLNFPRANIFFQFDKPRGLMFALFGREGKIIENKYSDVIEVLDLKDFKKGWCRVEYYNRAEISLKTHLNLFPLSNCLLLAYGGETGRKSRRIACLINLMRYEVTKIDKQMSEQIAAASKKSPKLSSIMSGLSLKESKTMSNFNESLV